MLERETSADGKVTHGFLVAVELKADGPTPPHRIADCLKDAVERWEVGKADVQYLGEIDCYEAEKES